jgi:uncharacterized protein involved in outer membrane biogenesis
VTQRSILRIVAVVVAVPAVLLACLALYLRFADLSGWRDTVAEKVSRSLGRKITIAGEFKPEIGFTTRLTAGEITLANPDWCDDTTMASVRRLVVELNLWSLVSGPLTIHEIELEGARVVLEKDADGRANWDFDTGRTSKAPSGPLELVLQHVVLDDVQLTYREPSRSTPLESAITHFETTEDHAGMLQIEFDGTVDQRAVRISGTAGTLAGLLSAGAVECDVTGQMGGVQVATKGTVADLKALGGVNLTASFKGDDVGDLRGLFNLPLELTGPFNFTVAVSPSGAESGVRLEATVAGINAKVDGTVDSLRKPKILDATVTASGPSIRTVGALTGVANLPDNGFSVTGGVRWEGFPVTFRQVEVTVGDNTLSADGTLGAPPEMMGSDFSLEGRGPDLSTLGALVGIDLPHETYSLEGRVVRVDGGVRVEGAEARIGGTLVRVDGTVGDPPNHAGTSLTVHAEGPDLAEFDKLIGAKLPARPFTIDGRLATDGSALTIDGVDAKVGDTHLKAGGNLKLVKRLVGTNVKVDARGSDATDLKILLGLKDLPSEAWSARGGITFIDGGLQLDGASVTVGSLKAEGNGLLSTTRGLVGSDLQLHVEDPDLAHAMPIFGVEGFPSVPVKVDGRLRIETAAFGLGGVTGSAGDIELAVDGVIGTTSGLDGTRGHLTVRGPRLSSLEPYFRLDGLPPAPFSVTGDVRVHQGACTLEGVVAEVDRNRLTVNGTLVPVKGLVGTDVQIEMTAPDLGTAGRLAAGFVEVPDLPAEPMTLATHLRVNEAGYDLDGFRATLDTAVANIDGRVGAAAGFVGTNLSFQADGPDSSLFSALTGVAIPVAPFKLSGRIERTDDVMFFDHVAVRLGGHTIDLHGSLGEKPRLIGTDLDLYVSGPGTGLIAEVTGFDKLPDKPFAVSGSFRGTPEKFTADNLEITLGESDLKGSIEVDIRGKPQVTARVSSNHLELGKRSSPAGDDTGERQPPQPANLSTDTGLVFSKQPIDFGWLERANADVDVTIGTLQMPVERFHDVELTARLVDGRLDVDHIAMAGARGGNGSGSLVLEPSGDDYRVELDLDINDVRFDLPGENAPDAASEPPVAIDVHLQAQGASPHDFADSSNGSIQFVVGRGVMNNRIADLITADILLTLLNAFNPFAKENVATELECAVVLLTFDQGEVTLQPMALQSNKMTMLGHGRVDLGTEKLNLDWITKPRKGIGISASMITNPYIKLGGTLRHPVVELKPMQAVASTGAAVATFGITWVAKGMLDRASADKKVCEQALAAIAKAGREQ